MRIVHYFFAQKMNYYFCRLCHLIFLDFYIVFLDQLDNVVVFTNRSLLNIIKFINVYSILFVRKKKEFLLVLKMF